MPNDGEIVDAMVGRAGGAAECHPVPCPEMIAAIVNYRSGVEHSVVLQVTGGLRVVGSERIDGGPAPPPADGGKARPPGEE